MLIRCSDLPNFAASVKTALNTPGVRAMVIDVVFPAYIFSLVGWGGWKLRQTWSRHRHAAQIREQYEKCMRA